MANEFKELYITKTADIGGKAYTAGGSYSVDKHEAETLLQKGLAEEITLPSIDAIRSGADVIAHEYDRKRRELQRTERYAHNETERDYLLKELDEHYQAKLRDFNFDLQAEMEALKAVEASQALSFAADEASSQEAKKKVESIVTQLQIAVNPANVLDLIEMSVNTFGDAEKIEMLKRFGEIKTASGDNNKSQLERIEKALRTIENPHLKRIQWIKALELSGVKASTKYESMRRFLKGGAYE